ncbi:PAS domain-containing protein, partial [Poseidonibacter sp.]|uniref:sensor histidine kinase n=1 Tax=Poseidonibacter sp. TaxID=2321188 RepID=UPI003C722F00
MILGLFFYLTTNDKNKRITEELENKMQTLETNYLITLDYFINDVKSVKSEITNNKTNIKILEQALVSNQEQKIKLRKKLNDSMTMFFEKMKQRGIIQIQFVDPSNKSFLRMNYPDKFGDELNDIRYSFNYVRQTKKDIFGFEHGRTVNAFRYVFPFFNENKKYLGAVEISLSSDYLQEKLININKIHTHFLINKNVFLANTLLNESFKSRYIKSIEHKDYFYSKPDNEDMFHLISGKKILESLKEKIDKKMTKNEKFYLYKVFSKNVNIISFLPIQNIKKDKTIAYLVSYTEDKNVYNILLRHKIINIIFFIIMLFLFYFVYKNLNHKKNLVREVKIKTRELRKVKKELEFLNENLEIKVKEKTKEQDILLSLFDIGDTVLFKWKNDKSWTIEHVSSNISKFLEFTSDEFYNENIKYSSFIHKEDIQRVTNEVKEASSSNKSYFKHEPYRVITKSAKIKWVLDYTVIIRNEKNEIISYIGYILDITEERENEKLFFEQSKMASMGEMIGNIAHQWRQPLSVISTISTGAVLNKEFGLLSDEMFVKDMDIINKNVQYLSRTIDDFRNFIKGDRTASSFFIKDCIDSFLHLIEGSKKSNNINMVLDIKDDIKLYAYPNELIQCFLNLFNNAKDELISKDEDDRFLFI